MDRSGCGAVRRPKIAGRNTAHCKNRLSRRRAGLLTDLVEIDPSWREYGAGITITGPTLRALRTLDVLDPVIAQGATWDGAKVHDRSGKLLEEVTFPALTQGLPATGGIMRPLLHKILSAKTVEAGTNVWLGTTVAHLVEKERQVEVTRSDGTRADYDLVIAADGIHSRLRERVFPGSAAPVFTGQVVHRLVARRPPGFDRSHFFMGEDSKVGFNPVSATHMYMFLLHPASADRRVDLRDQPQRLYEAMEGYGGFVPQIR